ncbi:MAG: aldo/keto reductase [Bacteroidales bacterium]|nr:aldo/keto reductase [Bacteroidales bacterium]
MKNQNRRTFIKSGLLGAAGVAYAGNRKLDMNTGSPDDKPVITRTLGKTGLEMPVISMGVMRADNPNLLKAAIKSGIIHFDTAHGYQDGRNEEMVGDVMKEYDRKKIIITTKVRPAGRQQDGSFGPEYDEKEFREMLETSLSRLKMDYVDILLLHGSRGKVSMESEPVWEVMNSFKKQGKTRFIGTSTHSNEVEVIEGAIERGDIDVVLTAINFKQDHVDKLKEVIARAAEAGIGIIGMKNMAGGYLDEEKQKPVDPKAALKWVLQDPNITTCIPGFVTFDQMEQDLEVMRDIILTDDELKSLQLAAAETGLYCQGCESCIVGCQKNLPIPDLMRAYMYAYGYSQMEKAQRTVAEANVIENPCSGCQVCTAHCVKGFKLAEKIGKISRISSIPEDFLV